MRFVLAFPAGVVQRNSALHAPGREVPRSQFTAVVHTYALRPAALEDDPVERSRHALTRQTGIDFQGRAFAREGIDGWCLACRSEEDDGAC